MKKTGSTLLRRSKKPDTAGALIKKEPSKRDTVDVSKRDAADVDLEAIKKKKKGGMSHLPKMVNFPQYFIFFLFLFDLSFNDLFFSLIFFHSGIKTHEVC